MLGTRGGVGPGAPDGAGPGRRGYSAVEVGVAMLIAAVVGVPMLTLLFQGRDTEQRSRFELLAVLAARDEMYQARLMVACGVAPGSVAHGPRALTGNPLESLRPIFRGDIPSISYYKVQDRVVTTTSVQGNVNGASRRIHLAEVTARWNDTVTPARDARKSAVVLPFGVLVPP